MKKYRLSLIAPILVVLCASMIAFDDVGAESDWKCEALLCLANPGGARQYSECNPPMDKLERWLYDRKPFPQCNQADGCGLGIKQGYERYYSCQEAYGEGYQLTIIDTSEEGYFSNNFFQRNKKCRKFMGYKTIRQLDGNDYVEKKVPVYSDRPIKWRTKPFYVEVKNNGQNQGQRYYYKVKKKKRGLF